MSVGSCWLQTSLRLFAVCTWRVVEQYTYNEVTLPEMTFPMPDEAGGTGTHFLSKNATGGGTLAKASTLGMQRVLSGLLLCLVGLPLVSALQSTPARQCKFRYAGAYGSASRWQAPQAFFDGEKPSALSRQWPAEQEGEKGPAPLDVRAPPATAFFSPKTSSSSSGSYYEDEDEEDEMDFSDLDLPPAPEPIREGEPLLLPPCFFGRGVTARHAHGSRLASPVSRHCRHAHALPCTSCTESGACVTQARQVC